MGSGKSSVGRILSSRLDRPLFDSDEMIEDSSGCSIREIWETSGESAFRDLETHALSETLAFSEPSVVATGGGVVLREVNRRMLTESESHVVWLKINFEGLVERIRNGRHRPLLDDDPETKLRTIADEREPLYREVADAIVSADNRSQLEVAKAVIRCCA